MGHVVFAAPTIDRFQLHDQLARRLLRRGHRLAVLTADPVTHRCFRVHGLPSRELVPGRTACAHPRVPLEEFALLDCRLAGAPRPGLTQLRAHRVRLERLVTPLLRFFETDVPDVVFVHQQRGGLHRLIHFVAREFGSRILHTGDGLLPGTMQRDADGVDGDASTCRRNAAFYREQRADEMFLAAALTATLGGASPLPLPQREVHAPDLIERAGCLAEALRRGRLGAAVRNLGRWQRASERPTPSWSAAPAFQLRLPDEPFVAVLLQRPDCPRIRLDTVAAPSQAELVLATQRAVYARDSSVRVVIVPPPGGMARDQLLRLRQGPPGLLLCEPDAAVAAACTAAAVITVNHPLGMACVVAGTPLVHLGRTPYGVPGVSTRSTLDRLPNDLARAVDVDHRQLCERFATRMLKHDHVWCNAAAPDHNGVHGLLMDIEHRAQRTSGRPSDRLVYRAGPAWPLVP